ncbi:hypothetical protein NQZ68_012377 [Dissostichus eleginoides]|nr:hypothetical protein NQZ68_012377 [Dissostichus eleginoides]
MNHEPSQFYGPPKREGATLNVPLPQSATLSDMCVNGPIVYECLDSVLRSQVHLLQRNAPTGHHPLPLVGGARSPAARTLCSEHEQKVRPVAFPPSCCPGCQIFSPPPPLPSP